MFAPALVGKMGDCGGEVFLELKEYVGVLFRSEGRTGVREERGMKLTNGSVQTLYWSVMVKSLCNQSLSYPIATICKL